MKTKRILQIACLVWALVTSQFLSAIGPADFAGGDGLTPTSAYSITTADHLNAVRGESFAGVYFRLDADINLAEWSGMDPSNGWTPIPLGVQEFKGHFDGNDKTISGLWINRSEGYFGFFRSLSGGAEVTKLNLVLDDTKGGIQGQNSIGGLVGNVKGNVTIDGCSVTGNITGSGEKIGGLVGMYEPDNLTITNSFHRGDVIGGGRYVGGLIGGSDDWTMSDATLTLTNCYAVGDVDGGNNLCVGGLIGFVCKNTGSSLNEVQIENCYAQGTVNGNRAGGLIGEFRGSGTLSKCYAICDVTSTSDRAGGLIGVVGDETPADGVYLFDISQCYAGGSVTATTSEAGGLVGSYKAGKGYTLSECYTTNSVVGTDNIGGLIGQNVNSNLLVQNCIAANISISGTSNVGTLVGMGRIEDPEVITACSAFGGIVVTGSGGLDATSTISKENANNQATYSTWDFTSTWTWGNGGYVLPVFKGSDGQPLAGQPTTQPPHLQMPTSLLDLQGNEPAISVNGHTIQLENVVGIVTITDLSGISQRYPSNGSLNIAVNASGVYILTINGTAYKVFVK